MTFVDRIADSSDLSDVFDLVNEFVTALHQARGTYKLPIYLRPIAIGNIDELFHWLLLTSEEIKGRDRAGAEMPEVMFWFHSELETAAQKVRSGM